MEASLDVRAARLLQAWADALEELHVEARRAASGDADGAAGIALLHVLEERAHEAFAAYREVVLRR